MTSIYSQYRNLIDAIYPAGSIYTSTRNVSPADFLGGTWTPIKDTFLMCAGDTYKPETTGGAANVALKTENLPAHAHGLNSHTHSVPAHAHGLNSHTHSIPALSGSAASAGAHTHAVSGTISQGGSHGHKGYYRSDVKPTTASTGAYKLWVDSTSTNKETSSGSIAVGEGEHNHSFSSGSAASAGAHTHTVSTTANTSGAASGNTANSSALTSGAASGNTASTGSGAAFSILPPYKTVYAWERVA